MSIIQELEEAIQEHKLEMLVPSRDYTDGEVVFNKGYVNGLEAALELIVENNRKINLNLN
jgi:hypothetical protein